MLLSQWSQLRYLKKFSCTWQVGILQDDSEPTVDVDGAIFFNKWRIKLLQVEDICGCLTLRHDMYNNMETAAATAPLHHCTPATTATIATPNTIGTSEFRMSEN